MDELLKQLKQEVEIERRRLYLEKFGFELDKVFAPKKKIIKN